MKHSIWASALLLGAGLAQPALAQDPGKSAGLELLGRYESGFFDAGGAEIPGYDPLTRRAFVVNAADRSVDVLDLRHPREPRKIRSIDIAGDLAPRTVGGANSVDIRPGLMAVAVEADPKQDDGWVALYSTVSLRLLGVVDAGALPDMVKFSPNGRYVLAANEGEPNSYGQADSRDPVGSVTIIDLYRWGRRDFARHVGFEDFNAGGPRAHELPAEVRVYGPGATVAQDLEPEYIAIDGDTAWVTLQEANALAVIDIRRAKVSNIVSLGFKDHLQPGNGFDASDRDGAINIANWPVFGMYQPDSIEAFTVRGRAYLITANEGDARDYDGFAEEGRVRGDLTLDPDAFPDRDALRDNTRLGRLTVTTELGDDDGDGDFERLYVLGGRSFSIWDAKTGALVFDSGDEIERITANLLPDDFNATNDANGSFDNRSDNKGPEPEGVAVGWVDGVPYAFLGLERIGGVMVYDLSDPAAPVFVDYVNNRNFGVDVCAEFDPADDELCIRPNPEAGDLGPEGLEFVPAWASATRKPLLIVGNEISGTTTVYEFRAPRRARHKGR